MLKYTFRGKRLDNQEWVMGSLWQETLLHGSYMNIYAQGETEEDTDEGWVHVTHESVGLSTELEDKNGKVAFEGDIIKIQLPLGGFWGNITQEKIGVIKIEPEHGGFIVQWEYSKNCHHIEVDCDVIYLGEIIGNITDNPDMFDYMKNVID